MSIVSVNLKGEIAFFDINQSRSFIKMYDYIPNYCDIEFEALAATHNRTKFKDSKY